MMTQEMLEAADNLDFVTRKGLNDSYTFYLKCIELIECNHYYLNTKLCEPMLGKYGLYNMTGASKDTDNIGEYCRKILYYCDGNNDLIDIYKTLDIDFEKIKNIIKILFNKKIIQYQ